MGLISAAPTLRIQETEENINERWGVRISFRLVRRVGIRTAHSGHVWGAVLLLRLLLRVGDFVFRFVSGV